MELAAESVASDGPDAVAIPSDRLAASV